MEGNNPHKGIAVFTFPDQEALKKWYDSPEYQSLVEARRQAADMVLRAILAQFNAHRNKLD